MRKNPALQGGPARELLNLVQTGRLFDFQKWVAEGNPLEFLEYEEQPVLLLRAITTGFHSMLELVLKSAKWSADDLTQGLDEALRQRRGDLVEVLLEAGAPIQNVDFEELCRLMHVPLMKKYLLAGGDPGKHNAFTYALSHTKAKPLLGFYKQMRGEYPSLDDQAALALYQAVSDKSVRWICLLIWAGADPFRKVPSGLDEDWDDEINMTTAASHACWSDNEALLPAMKLKPTKEQALELCRKAAFKPFVAKFEMLLRGFTSDELNTGERKSCKILEELVSHHLLEFKSPFYYSNKDPQRLQCIEWLLKRGARWNPSPENLFS